MKVDFSRKKLGWLKKKRVQVEADMKLQEFVSETLKEIIAGVKEAQEYAAGQGGKVNPKMYYNFQERKSRERRMTDDEDQQDLQDIEFDVAVTSSEGSGTQAGVGVFVAGISLGAKGKSDTSSSSISRITFKVPVALPIQK
ncbi:MAG: hypothetical protein ABH950_09145 [Candidatus Altiarchaeota archaeon]